MFFWRVILSNFKLLLMLPPPTRFTFSRISGNFNPFFPLPSFIILPVVQFQNYMANAENYFKNQFLSDLQAVGADVAARYGPLIEQYTSIVIPFQSGRLKQQQSLVFENSSLEANKMELLQRVEQLKAENERLQYSLQRQLKKINDLQRHTQDIERLNLDHQSEIESLRITNSDLTSLIERRDSEVKQLQKDKDSIMEKFEAKNADYNILLSNYMKQKNILAEKLNQMNQLQMAILQKDKQLKAEKFYIQKQWEQFQQAQKNQKTTPQPPSNNDKKSRIFGSRFFKQQPIQQAFHKSQKPQKSINNQILRSPLKKLVKYHNSEIYDLSMNYNGNILASCGGDRMIKTFQVHNLRPGPTMTSHSAESIFISIALNYAGDRLLGGSTDKSVCIFNSETGKQLHSFPGHGDKVNSVGWANTKEKCVSGSEDKQVKVWDIEKASNVFSIACGRSVKIVKTNSVQPVVYTGHGDGSLRIYSLSQGNAPVSQIKGLIDYPISSISIVSDNRYQILVSSLEGSSCHLLDMKMNKSIAKYEHKDFFNSSTQACFSPSEGFVLAGNCDGSIYYWDRFKRDMVKKVSGHDGAITAINYNFMSSLLASADKEGSLIIWQ